MNELSRNSINKAHSILRQATIAEEHCDHSKAIALYRESTGNLDRSFLYLIF